MTISVYDHGKTPTLEVGMLRADPKKPGVPLVGEEWVRGERVQAVTAYTHDPRWQSPGWETRAATADEIAASKGNAAPVSTNSTVAAPVAAATVQSVDWAALVEVAERKGIPSAELRQLAGMPATKGSTIHPAPAGTDSAAMWDAAIAKANQKFDGPTLSAAAIYDRRKDGASAPATGEGAGTASGLWDAAIAKTVEADDSMLSPEAKARAEAKRAGKTLSSSEIYGARRNPQRM
jgi:hypothetical protein